MVSTWNCCGLQNASPYLHELIKDSSDIIAVNEHWLWPCQLSSLNHIHPDFDGYGASDHRLNEHSDLVRGCGGIGIIWRKSLEVSPLTNICSDRICAATPLYTLHYAISRSCLIPCVKRKKIHILQHARQGRTLGQLSGPKQTMLASSVPSVVACNVTAPRVCTLALCIR